MALNLKLTSPLYPPTTGTDRGDPPFGNSVNKASVSADFDETAAPSKELLLAEHFQETIGLALDIEKRVAYVSDLLGNIWSVNLDDGSRKAIIRDRGNYTGITLQKVTQ